MRKLTAIVAVLFTIGLSAMGQSQTGQTPMEQAASVHRVAALAGGAGSR